MFRLCLTVLFCIIFLLGCGKSQVHRFIHQIIKACQTRDEEEVRIEFERKHEKEEIADEFHNSTDEEGNQEDEKKGKKQIKKSQLRKRNWTWNLCKDT